MSFILLLLLQGLQNEHLLIQDTRIGKEFHFTTTETPAFIVKINSRGGKVKSQKEASCYVMITLKAYNVLHE